MVLPILQWWCHPAVLILRCAVHWGGLDQLTQDAFVDFIKPTHRHLNSWRNGAPRSWRNASGSTEVDGAPRFLEERKEHDFKAGRWYDGPGPNEMKMQFICKMPEESAGNECSNLDEAGLCGGEVRAKWRKFQGYCYSKVKSYSVGYKQAQRCCQQIPEFDNLAHVVSIKTAEENEFVTQMAQENMKVKHEKPHFNHLIEEGEMLWLGAKEAPNSEKWFWDDGTVLGTDGAWAGYNNWDGDEPNNFGDRDEDHAFLLPVDSGFEDGGYWVIVFIVFILYAGSIITAHLIFASCYKSKVTNFRPKDAFPQPSHIQPELNLGATSGKFKYGLFENCCWQDCDMCIHGFCCQHIRAADTHEYAGSGSFWMIVLWAEFAGFIGNLVGTIDEGILGFDLSAIPWYLIYGAMIACVMTGKRKALRARLGEQAAEKSAFADCCLWWWCHCCVTCQEAKQVDEIQGVRISCCCNMTTLMASGTVAATMVGQPVAMAHPVQTVTVQAQPVMGQPVDAKGQPMNQPMTVVGQPVSATPMTVQAQPVLAQMQAQPVAVAQPMVVAQPMAVATPVTVTAQPVNNSSPTDEDNPNLAMPQK